MIHIPGIPGGVVASVQGMETIRNLPYVLEVCEELRPGQTIGREGTTAQTMVSVWLKGRDYTEYKNNIQCVKQLLRIEDKEGKSLLIDNM